MKDLTELQEITSKNSTGVFQQEKKSRRIFINSLLKIGVAGFLGSVLYPLFQYMRPPKQREVEVTALSIGKVTDFDLDSSKIIRFGNKPVIVIRTKSDVFKAFSASCTHLDCTVQYRKDMETIWCACHNGKYDLTGRNIAGPPPRPLEEYNTIIKNGELIITKKT